MTRATRGSGVRHEPTAIGHDPPGERVTDLDVEMEAPVLGKLIGIAARREPKRQRNAEHAPAPHHEPQPAAIDDQRHRDVDRAEALADEPLVSAAAFFLQALELAAREVASPRLASVTCPERDLHWDILT